MYVNYLAPRLVSLAPSVNVGNDYLPQLAHIFIKSQILIILGVEDHVWSLLQLFNSVSISQKQPSTISKSMGMAVYI